MKLKYYIVERSFTFLNLKYSVNMDVFYLCGRNQKSKIQKPQKLLKLNEYSYVGKSQYIIEKRRSTTYHAEKYNGSYAKK